VETIVIVLFVLLIAVMGFVWWESREGRRNVQAQLEAQRNDVVQTVGHVQTLQEQLKGVDSRFGSMQETVSRSLTSTSETIGNIREQLGGLGKSAERILEVGQDIAALQDILQPPKLRGGFGELLLERLLAQVLPAASFQTQYRFRNGEIVDAVITLPEGLIPVDSKFPVDSFKRLLEAETEKDRGRLRREFVRDVKARIDEVAKYVRPDEGTLDFALMYVPAENVYYEAIVGADAESPMTYALERRVYLVSPNTFHALLQALLRGLNILKVEEHAKEIMGRLGQLQREFDRFRGEFDVLGTHVSRAKNKYDELDKMAGRLTDRLALPLEEPHQELPAAAPSTDEGD
jgi:DNA recombination protein RmuC